MKLEVIYKKDDIESLIISDVEHYYEKEGWLFVYQKDDSGHAIPVLQIRKYREIED